MEKAGGVFEGNGTDGANGSNGSDGTNGSNGANGGEGWGLMAGRMGLALPADGIISARGCRGCR